MATIRFEIRKELEDSDNLIPIRLVYQVKSERRFMSAKEKVPLENWDSEMQRATIYVLGQNPYSGT